MDECMNIKLIASGVLIYSIGFATHLLWSQNNGDPSNQPKFAPAAQEPIRNHLVQTKNTQPRGEKPKTKTPNEETSASKVDYLSPNTNDKNEILSDTEKELAMLRKDRLIDEAKKYAEIRRLSGASINQQLNTHFEREERDSSWSLQQESLISQELQSADDTISIVNTECRKTQCRLSIITPRDDQRSISQILSHTLNDRTSKLELGTYITQRDTSSGTTYVYIDRTGDDINFLDQMQ